MKQLNKYKIKKISQQINEIKKNKTSCFIIHVYIISKISDYSGVCSEIKKNKKKKVPVHIYMYL